VVLKTHRDALIRAVHDVAVIDQEHRLVGLVAPEQLLLASRNGTVAAVMRRDVPRLHSEASLADITKATGWRTLHALPVVDGAGVFIGILRYETLRWIEQELTEGRPDAEMSTARALGELFATAMGGMFEAIIETTKERDRDAE
jgi:Mg/Co/Ni transporter MgtE